MGDSSLFVHADDWVYTYPVGDGNCHVIGHGIEFVERKSESILVKLDDEIELNVPVSDRNLFVDSTGVHDVDVKLDQLPVDAGMIRMVVAATR